MKSEVTSFQSHNPELKKRIAQYLEMIFKNSSDNHLNRQVLERFLWTATEDNDKNDRVKYLGQPYWSKNAILRYQEQNTGKRKKNFKHLRHDHAVPKKIIREKILDLENKDFDNILNILESYAHAAVITKEENQQLNDVGLNQKMQDGFDKNDDIVSRYRLAGIDLFNVSNIELKEIEIV